jgi:hypothetical protein
MKSARPKPTCTQALPLLSWNRNDWYKRYGQTGLSDGISLEVSVEPACRPMYFALAPASKVYTPNGMAIIEE